MRLHCYFCSKSVSTEVSDETVIRAALVCPECIETGKILLLEGVDGHQAGHPDHTRHANIQSVKNIPPQTVARTPAECAIAMNNLTPEQVGRAMEKLPTDALEWAVKFEALSHPSLGQISGEVSEVKTAPAGGKE